MRCNIKFSLLCPILTLLISHSSSLHVPKILPPPVHFSILYVLCLLSTHHPKIPKSDSVFNNVFDF